MQYSLLPRDTTEDRDAIIEIRAGTGGDEASLFAGDLLRMYQRLRKNAAGASSIWKAARRTWADSRKSSAALPGKKCSDS